MTFTDLRNRREHILEQMADIRRVKRGSLSAQSRNPSGSCVRHIYQRWQGGRNHSTYIPAEQVPALQAAIDNAQRFEVLAKEFLEVTEQITDMEVTLLPSKKLQQSATQEKFAETQAFLQVATRQLREQGVGDLGVMEEALRTALLNDGRKLLEDLLNDPQLRVPHDSPRSGEKVLAHRPRTVQSVFGPLYLKRRYYYDSSKALGGCGRVPLDRALGLVEDFTPALARLAARACAQSSFEEASADLAEYVRVKVPARQLQRMVQILAPQMRQVLKALAPPAGLLPVIIKLYILMDGTGVPMHKRALRGVLGRAPDGQARTREVKLGCVFTQSTVDAEGQPVRDEASTTYVACLDQAAQFGGLLRAEALYRGLERAAQVVVLGDGAAWIWELARVNFAGAIEIVDFWHACEHLSELNLLLPGGLDGAALQARFARWRQQLSDSKLSEILAEAAELSQNSPRDEAQLKAFHTAIGYFQKQQSRMDYAAFRAQGLFIGSGVVEAGCKTLIGQRLKRSGMFWGETGAHNILTLRTALMSQNRFDEFWKLRVA